jgi:hypothetical protein
VNPKLAATIKTRADTTRDARFMYEPSSIR